MREPSGLPGDPLTGVRQIGSPDVLFRKNGVIASQALEARMTVSLSGQPLARGNSRSHLQSPMTIGERQEINDQGHARARTNPKRQF